MRKSISGLGPSKDFITNSIKADDIHLQIVKESLISHLERYLDCRLFVFLAIEATNTQNRKVTKYKTFSEYSYLLNRKLILLKLIC